MLYAAQRSEIIVVPGAMYFCMIGSRVAVVSYPDPDSHSCGWITSPLRGKRVWRTAVLNSVHGHQNVGEPIRFEVCNNSLLTRVY